jgi:hypothetical protein
MAESKLEYFYLWQNRIILDDDQIVSRTCFGVTGNPFSPNGRLNGYEGHNGKPIQFKDMWVGPKRPIKDLEDHIKAEFYDYAVIGHLGFRYEWINEEIDYDQIKSWVDWEVSGHPSISKYVIV